VSLNVSSVAQPTVFPTHLLRPPPRTWLTWVIGIAIGLFVGAVAMAFVCRRRVALANSSADIAMSVGNYEHHTDTV
jgi:hypothetical protein